MKKIKLNIIALFIILISTQNVFSQVLISEDTGGAADQSAMLEIQSNSKGLLIPRLTTAQRTSLTSSAKEGLLVYDSDMNSFFIYGVNSSGSQTWVDLSTSAEIWSKSGNNVFLSNPNYNLGIGTSNPTKKFVLKAENENDTLFEIQDQNGNPLMVITPSLTKFNIIKNTKGVSGGFAVGRYEAAKANPDTTLFIVTPDSTRVYTSANNTKGVSGGFAVGRYEAAKNGGGVRKYFYTGIDSTRIYTDGSGLKGVAGGFAVGRYEAAKGGENNYMYMVPDNYFLGHQSGEALQNSTYTGKFNTFFGYKTGLVDTSGSRNVFLGYEAGYSNTTGADNVLLGFSAGHEITTADNNISIGSGAGYFCSTGDDNVFIGRNAARGTNAGITGSRNIIIGKFAGYKLSDGEDNVFIGTHAGYNTIGGGSPLGNYNVFLGNMAGLNNITGYGNTYIGNQAGANSTGYRNTFVGQSAGISSLTSSNTYIGQAAGRYNSSGAYNVIIGDHAGFWSTEGSNNLIIGYNAGLLSNGDTMGDGNVLIGNNAGGNATGISNELFIDNSNTSTPLIHGDFSQNIVQINDKLNIAGQYTFPTTDGAPGQVLKTNGAGILTWEANKSFENPKEIEKIKENQKIQQSEIKELKKQIQELKQLIQHK